MLMGQFFWPHRVDRTCSGLQHFDEAVFTSASHVIDVVIVTFPTETIAAIIGRN